MGDVQADRGNRTAKQANLVTRELINVTMNAHARPSQYYGADDPSQSVPWLLLTAIFSAAPQKSLISERLSD